MRVFWRHAIQMRCLEMLDAWTDVFPRKQVLYFVMCQVCLKQEDAKEGHILGRACGLSSGICLGITQCRSLMCRPIISLSRCLVHLSSQSAMCKRYGIGANHKVKKKTSRNSGVC